MTLSTDRLIDLAQRVTGRPVRWHRGGPKGAWFPAEGLIRVRLGMSDTQTRCTVAHELAHASHGDPCGCRPCVERRADRRAAALLVSPAAYAQAELTFDGDIDRIAEDLGITVHLALTWRDSYECMRRSA